MRQSDISTPESSKGLLVSKSLQILGGLGVAGGVASELVVINEAGFYAIGIGALTAAVGAAIQAKRNQPHREL